jgi:hypothetical protein
VLLVLWVSSIFFLLPLSGELSLKESGEEGQPNFPQLIALLRVLVVLQVMLVSGLGAYLGQEGKSAEMSRSRPVCTQLLLSIVEDHASVVGKEKTKHPQFQPVEARE